MRYFSMFSGIGGFELGIERAYRRKQESIGQGYGGQNICRHWDSAYPDSSRSQSNKEQGCGLCERLCVGYSEIDKYAIATYEKNFGKEIKNYGDATRINTAELPDFDLLVGGFPCQAFSVAGKRAGFNDTRGTLIFDVVRILRDKRPRYFVLENVKGLLSHDSGKTFSHILEILTDSGYDVSWSVHNSKNYGVPQNRERIYLIGSLRGEPRPQVFPITTSSEQALRQIVGGSQGNRVYDTDGISSTIASQAGGLGGKTGLYISKVDRNKGIYKLKESETAGTLTSTMFKGIDASGRTGVIARAVLTPDRLKKRQNGRRFKEIGEPSFTLNTQDRHGIYDGVKIRRLTPTECERLQGFPDNWTIGSDTQRYKQCGNAVTVNVVETIMKGLMPCLEATQLASERRKR